MPKKQIAANVRSLFERGTPERELLDAARAVAVNASDDTDWEVVRASDLAALRAVLEMFDADA